MKTCKSVHAHHRMLLMDEHTRFQEEIKTVAAAEFPKETRVAWRMPGHKVNTEGHVTGHLEGETGAVMVKSDGGTGYTLRAWELTKLSTP